MIMLGYLHDGVAYVATDMRRILYGEIRIERAESNHKVKRLSNGLIVGAVGDRVVCQRLLAHPELFSLDKKGRLTKKHIVNEIVPAIHEFLKDKDLYETADDGQKTVDVEMFLAKDDVLYGLTDVFWTYRVNSLAAGQMSGYCESALDEIDPDGDIGLQLASTMHRANAVTDYIGGPFLVVNTRDDNYRIVEAEECI